MASEEIKDISTRGALVAIAIAVIVIAILIGTAVLRGNQVVNKLPDKDKYQAVFLTNGQTFFGKLTGLGSAYVTIEDAYRLQAAQSTPSPGATPGPQFSLLDTEKSIEGPEDSIQVASDQIIFWENLKGDSKVVEAINQAKKENK